jgi:hypothetical protein
VTETPVEVLFMRYGWVFLLAGTLLNVPCLWRRARPRIAEHPELATGYRRLIREFAFWVSLPWLVMGFGVVVGSVPTIFNFLSPVAGGPFVWAWWLVIYAEFLLVLYWVVFRSGAEVLACYPGVLYADGVSVREVRLQAIWFAVSGLLWNTAFLTVMS